MNLDIEIHSRNRVMVIKIGGEIDLYSSPQFRKRILETIENKPLVVLVDLENVRYMDSSGVATLIEGLKQANQYKGRFVIAGLRAEVREVFELTRLDKVFEIYYDSETALETLPV